MNMMAAVREMTSSNHITSYLEREPERIEMPVRRDCQSLECLIDALADEVEEHDFSKYDRTLRGSVDNKSSTSNDSNNFSTLSCDDQFNQIQRRISMRCSHAVSSYTPGITFASYSCLRHQVHIMSGKPKHNRNHFQERKIGIIKETPTIQFSTYFNSK